MAAIRYRSLCNGRTVPCAITLWNLNPHHHITIYLMSLTLCDCLGQATPSVVFAEAIPQKDGKALQGTHCCQKLDEAVPKNCILQLLLLAELDTTCCRAWELCSLSVKWSLVPKFLQQGIWQSRCSFFCPAERLCLSVELKIILFKKKKNKLL